tara:strand:+ start:43 stop:405 length:363 start_codon:yes stop_codon:yes gene_type:complete
MSVKAAVKTLFSFIWNPVMRVKGQYGKWEDVSPRRVYDSIVKIKCNANYSKTHIDGKVLKQIADKLSITDVHILSDRQYLLQDSTNQKDGKPMFDDISGEPLWFLTFKLYTEPQEIDINW